MERYLGLDVHAESSTLVVLSAAGKRIGEHVLETNGHALVEAIRAIPGRKHLCFEEGTQSAWVYEILSPHVHDAVVTSVRGARGPKSDARDAGSLAEKLRTGAIERRVFKAPGAFSELRELARTHTALSRDLVRVQARLKSVYRSRGVRAVGQTVYGAKRRAQWQEQLPHSAQLRARSLYEQLDFLVELKERAEHALVREARKHPVCHQLQSVPGLGPIRVARMVPIVVTPHRFRTRAQFWSYCGLGIVQRSSADWVRTAQGQWVRAQVQRTCGLNRAHNPVLKDVFKGAATTVVTHLHSTAMYQEYSQCLEAGTRPNLAKLTLARKIASTALALWKKGETYSL